MKWFPAHINARSLYLLMALGCMALFSCSKEYSIENGFEEIPAGSWEFKDSLNLYTGNVDTAFVLEVGAQEELHILGTSKDGNHIFDLVLFGDTIGVGTYKASLFQTTFNYSSGNNTLFQAGQLIGEFIVTITSFDGKIVSGTFVGQALDSSGALRGLFDGKFTTTLGDINQGPPSIGVLGDSSGFCQPVTLNGVYKQGIVMNAGNTVSVQVSVTEAGSYYIYTDAVNGITFSGAGTFDNTGAQTVILQATGTPAFNGLQQFTLHYGNSQCAFTIDFVPGAAPSGDYYPTSENSNWEYENSMSSDTYINKVAPGNKVIDGTTYAIIGVVATPQSTTFDTSLLVSKSDGIYYGYLNYADWIPLDQDAYAQTIFLIDTLAAGSSWNGPAINGTVGGVPLSLTAKFTILEKGVPANLGSFNFPDVIKVKMEFFSGGFSLGISGEIWYAKNVGPIYIKDPYNEYIIKAYTIF